MPPWPLIEPSFKRIARFAPFVGLLIGLLQSFVWTFLNYFNWPNISAALISLVISIFITGGLHLDGLMDTVDGIGAGPKNRLKAMKDSRVGAMGVQSIIIILILQIAAIIKLDSSAIFAFPLAAFWGRVSQIFAIGNYKYVSLSQSGQLHKKYWEGIPKEIIPTLIIIIFGILSFLSLNNFSTSNILLLFSFLFTGLLTSIFIPYVINKLLGGHNGDSYGAGLIITETANLLMLSIILAPN